jgi:uncharacterized protein (DUF1501 family)
MDHSVEARLRDATAMSRRRLLSFGAAAGLATLMEGASALAEVKHNNVVG